MNIGNVLKSAAVAVSAIAIMGTAAHAATREINLYGASAQYIFWNDVADNFLTSKGCSDVRQAQSSDTKHGISLGNACTGYGGDNLIIRYSSKASYDGIRAMKSVDNPDGCTITNPPDGSKFRKMANEGTISGTTVGGTRCVDVTLGCSDVAGKTFVQESHGQLRGHLLGGWVDRVFNKIDASGLTVYQPLVVPFAFFKHNTTPLPNVTRLQAVMIYSGSVANWNQFDPAYPANQIVACLRHAGSGTHATLDAAVMRGDWPLAITEDPAGIFGGPKIYFNDGSSDMMNCLNDNAYSLGYADADQGNKANTVGPLNYMGAAPTRANIKFGVYEFWSAQWIYEDPGETNYGTTHPVVVDLMNFASNPANLPPLKALYWATKNEMTVSKTDDFAYPSF